jgi:hypothetical protein
MAVQLVRRDLLNILETGSKDSLHHFHRCRIILLRLRLVATVPRVPVLKWLLVALS